MPTQWIKIEDAPKSASPIWVRGWDFGKVDGTRHHTWAHWDGANWCEAGCRHSTLLYLTDYLPGAA